MPDYWFKPKTYGYGATPVTWQGWVVTTAFAAALVIVTLGLTQLMDPKNAVAAWVVAGCFALLAAAIIGFIRFAEHKTDGGWKWRWGGKE